MYFTTFNRVRIRPLAYPLHHRLMIDVYHRCFYDTRRVNIMIYPIGIVCQLRKNVTSRENGCEGRE